MAPAKGFTPPKAVGSWPSPPTIDGTPPFHGDEVHHPIHGPGRFGYVDWVDTDGAYVSPQLAADTSRRDTSRGHWQAVVTIHPAGGYRCPISELSRTL